MPADTGMAIVIIMHLDPNRESRIAEIFRGSTSMEVTAVSSPQRLEPDHVYVIVPDSSLELRDGVINPNKPDDPHGHRHPVDRFFTTLAADQKERAVAIVLSGTGNNGSHGIRDVKAQGGLCIAQDPATAEYDGMPQSAIDAGVIDEVMPPEEMPSAILHHAAHPQTLVPGEDRSSAGPTPGDAFHLILELLSRTYRVTFRSAYKRGTLSRRTERRMGLRQIPNWDAYLEVLKSEPDEVAALYGDILVGVTQFFRDPAIWEELQSDVLPGILARHDRDTPVKFWVPGCATGEEAYTLAIIVREALERSGGSHKVQIFATDISESSLAIARQGVYPSSIGDVVSPARRSRFFRSEGERLRITRDIRDTLTFSVHNLLSDPPFSKIDLLSCRNVLIYLEPHAQTRILELFHFALSPGGFLVLGGSEAAAKHGNIFEAVSPKGRIYRATGKNDSARMQPISWTVDRSRHGATRTPAPTPAEPKGPKLNRMIEQIVLSRYTAACVVVTESFEIQSFFGPTHQYLAQPTGEARFDLLAWAKPGIYPRLRFALEGARDGNQQVSVADMRVERDGVFQQVECTIEPIAPLLGEAARFFLVCFRDVRRRAAAEDVAPNASAEPIVRQLEGENQDLRGELLAAVEQLESTNEEHRSSNEELLSLNEELQSNNEELQASKEELQSLNEEMLTINKQLEEKNIELRATTADLNNLLVSTDIPIIFLDRDLRVRRFTPAATQLMRLVSEDLGRSIEHIKERVDDGALISDAREVLEKLVPITVDVRAENGHWFTRTLRPYRTEDDRIDGVCIAFFDITKLKKAAAEHEDARRSAEAFVRESPGGLLVLDGAMHVVTANDAFCKLLGVSRAETEGQVFFELGNRQWDIPRLRDLLEKILPEASEITEYEVTSDFEQLGRRTMLLHARRMSRGDQPAYVLLGIEDLTERRIVENTLRTRADELAREQERKNEFLAMLGHELRNPMAAVSYGLDLLRLIPDDDAGRREEIRTMMERQAKRIVCMLDQLLDAARLVKGKASMMPGPVNLKDAVQAAVEAVTPVLQSRKHEISVSLPSEDVVVNGDAGRLTQVVENLVNNAAKYMDEGGKVTLTMEVDKDEVQLHVRDGGIGIEAELLPHIFDLFSQGPRTLDRAAGGLGLGLPLVKQVVHMHGGRVEATSAGRGHGSEFTVMLPRTRLRSKTRTGTNESGARSQEHPRRILVVDDQEDVRGPLADLLGQAGHEVLAVGDGPSALEAVSSFGPDVALIDLGMPQMDGYEVARRLRKEHKHDELFLIAVTGYQSDTARLNEAGFDRHLIKPPSREQLLAAVAERASDRVTGSAKSGRKSQRGKRA